MEEGMKVQIQFPPGNSEFEDPIITCEFEPGETVTAADLLALKNRAVEMSRAMRGFGSSQTFTPVPFTAGRRG